MTACRLILSTLALSPLIVSALVLALACRVARRREREGRDGR